MALIDLGQTADYAAIWADWGRSGTYRHGGSHTVTPEALSESVDYTEEAVTLVAYEATKREIAAAAGKIVEGDWMLLVLVSDLTGDPAADDRVTIGSESWRVKTWSKNPDDRVWIIGSEKVN